MTVRSRRSAWGIAACAVLTSGLPVNAFAQSAGFSPRIWGELGYDYRSQQFEAGSDVTEQTALLRLKAASYLYEPWLATIEGGVGLNFRESERDSGTSYGDQVVGDALLRLLPLSRFPLELFAERTNSSTDTDLIGTELDLTRYGFQQRYTARSGTSMRLRYERSEEERVLSPLARAGALERNETDLWQGAFNTSFGAHAVLVDASYSDVDRDRSTDMSRTSFASLRHTYRPGPQLNAQDLITFNGSDLRQGPGNFRTDLVQLSTFAHWRPMTERPSRVNTTLRVVERDSRNDGFSSSGNTVTGTVGGSYQWTPRLVGNASAGASTVETNTSQQASSFQSANLVYTSETRELLGFDIGLFSQGDLRNNVNGHAVQSAGVQLGYDASRGWRAGERARLAFDAGQSVSHVQDSEDFAADTLLSRVAGSWMRSGTATSSMARLSFSDSRTFARGPGAEETEGRFQLANLQASFDQRLSVTKSFRGNLTIQATRSERGNIGGDVHNGEWHPNASVDLSYVDSGFFGVPRLRFRSTLRFISDSYFPELDQVRSEDGRSDRQWENRLEYTIGRLQLRAIARVSEIREQQQSLLLFQARRMFGDM